MKKIFFLIISVLIVGCSSKENGKLVCEYYTSDNLESENQTVDQITFYFQDDESINYEKKTTVVFENYDEASQYYDIIYTNNDSDNLEVVDNQVIISVSENLDDMTKDEVRSMYEKYGFTCK